MAQHNMHSYKDLVASKLSWSIHAHARVGIDGHQHTLRDVRYERRQYLWYTWPLAPGRRPHADDGRDHVLNDDFVIDEQLSYNARVTDGFNPVPTQVVRTHVKVDLLV